jgi:hypothetical protein
MRFKAFLSTLGIVCISIAIGSDHNNLEKDRPLRFDDAYSTAYRSFEFQAGFGLDTFHRSKPIYNFKFEIQYGFAKNKDISIGLDPYFTSESGKLVGNAVDLSYFEGVSREIGNNPAFGYRIDAGIPISGGDGAEFRVRGILTKTLVHYDKIHLNLDYLQTTSGTSSLRKPRFGAIIGYSNPIGYPTRFDRTLLAEFGIEQGMTIGSGYNSWIGIGLRSQVSPTTVFDFGVLADISKASGELSSPLRISVGYSMNF